MSLILQFIQLIFFVLSFISGIIYFMFKLFKQHRKKQLIKINESLAKRINILYAKKLELEQIKESSNNEFIESILKETNIELEKLTNERDKILDKLNLN